MENCNLATTMARNAQIVVQESPWWTAAEGASYLKVEPRTLLLWWRQGRVKGYVLSGTERKTVRFKREDLDAAATLFSPSVAVVSTKGRNK